MKVSGSCSTGRPKSSTVYVVGTVSWFRKAQYCRKLIFRSALVMILVPGRLMLEKTNVDSGRKRSDDMLIASDDVRDLGFITTSPEGIR